MTNGFGGFAAGPAGGRQSLLPPWLFMPEAGSAVDLTSDAPVVVNNASAAVVLSLAIPAGLVIALHQIGFGALDMSAIPWATWSLKIGTAYLDGYHFLPAAIGSIDQPANVNIVAQGNQTLEVWVTNNHPARAFRYFARVAGWKYDPAKVGE